jgi:hypothetical protein
MWLLMPRFARVSRNLAGLDSYTPQQRNAFTLPVWPGKDEHLVRFGKTRDSGISVTGRC